MKATKMSTEDALALFDSLPAITNQEMLGTWKGKTLATGHQLDGLLEKYYWEGKRFISEEEVHPLVHRDKQGMAFLVNPSRIPMGLVMKAPLFTKLFFPLLFLALRGFFVTRFSQARLRMIEYRGVSSAAMQYDKRPINDYFRRMKDGSVLGLMDMKGMDKPFFFILERRS